MEKDKLILCEKSLEFQTDFRESTLINMNYLIDIFIWTPQFKG